MQQILKRQQWHFDYGYTLYLLEKKHLLRFTDIPIMFSIKKQMIQLSRQKFRVINYAYTKLAFRNS